jgi:RNA polymerase sigma-70 factor (ECF subfamily)
VSELTQGLAEAREQFLTMIADVRPELHRYCARLTGSVIAGEDIVQETLARAFYALSQATEAPALRPWLFRIAHNAALDLLKSHGHRLTEAHAALEELAGVDERPDPAVVRVALARFLQLPLAQRSAVILKDVLGHSLEETAATIGSTVLAVKAALVRGRRALAALADEERAQVVVVAEARAELERYAALFNARDWQGVRELVGDQCRLDLVGKSQRRGKAVGMYFDRYAHEAVTLAVRRLEGQLVLAAFVEGAVAPAYFIQVSFAGGRVAEIRDYRYVPYIAAEAGFEEA